MRFKDAAYEILKQEGKPLHYTEITDKALIASMLDTSGQTPHASMGALLYTDTLNSDSRFRRGDERGTFALKMALPEGIHAQIENIKARVRADLRNHLYQMPPQKFEELIRQLLVGMGFEETQTTPFSNDKGVDVRGVLRANSLSTVKIAIQAKRWTNNVGSAVVRDLRGSLKVADSEQGLVITPSDFTAEAKMEAQASGKTPIALINGEGLVELLIQHQVGITQQQYIVPSIDRDFWSEVLGVSFDDADEQAQKKNISGKSDLEKSTFPLAIQGRYQGQVFQAQLLAESGLVCLDGRDFLTPTAAAKVIVTGWKEVNGWDFWRYLDIATGEWKKIGTLRKVK